MKYIIFIMALMFSIGGYTQSVKYKDIAPIIETTSDEYALSVLKEFIVTNLDHPAANLKIATLYLKQAQETDPLIEFTKMQALAEEAKQRLFKASLVIDDKEVKKNEDFYLWVAQLKQQPVANYEIVHQYMEEKKNEINRILHSVPLVYNDFTNAVGYYDKSVKKFMNISSTYSSLKNLYMLYDEKLDEKFTSLKSSYDSSLWYFERYKSKTDTFPLKGYSQKLDIRPVIIYRYDGLVSQVNFLTDDVKIWNYGAWVDSVRKVVNNEIVGVRKLLEINEERQNQALEKLASSKNIENLEVVEIDKSILFNLLRYDYNNPIVPLLKFKESKQKLLLDQANDTYYDTAQISIDRKLVFYNKMLYNIKDCDSLIAQFDMRFDPVRMQKYKGFLEKHYDGIDGSKQYMFNEKNDLRKELAIYGSLLKEGVQSIKPIDSIGNYTKYKYLRIPLTVEPPDSVEMTKGALYTTHILKTADEGYYLSGIYVPDKKTKNIKAYLARINEGKVVKWFNQYDIEIDSAGTDSNNSIEAVALTNEGVAIVIRSEQIEKGGVASTFVHVLQDGGQKMIRRLDTDLFPRNVLFAEEQNNFLICLSGTEKVLNNTEKNELRIVNLNGLGEQVWVYSDYKLGGYIGMVNTQRGILITRNKEVSTGNEAILTMVNTSGTKSNEKTIDLGSDLINRVYKLNDTNISLLGTGYFTIINSRLEKIYP